MLDFTTTSALLSFFCCPFAEEVVLRTSFVRQNCAYIFNFLNLLLLPDPTPFTFIYYLCL